MAGEKPIAELSPDQAEARRQRNREAKQKSRAKLALLRIPDSWDWFDTWWNHHEEARANVRAFEDEFATVVELELGLPARLNRCDPYSGRKTLDYVSIALFCLRKGNAPYLRMTIEGLIAGGFVPVRAIGLDIVTGTHKFNLERSSTYSAAYRELLDRIQKLGPDKSDGIYEQRSHVAVAAEIAGTFEYVEPQPPKKPEPLIESPKEPLPRYEEHMQVQAEKFLRQVGEDVEARERREQMMNEGLLPPEARRYLNGY